MDDCGWMDDGGVEESYKEFKVDEDLVVGTVVGNPVA